MNLKSVKFNDMLRKGAKRLPLLGVLCLAMGLSSCDSVYDDDPNCVHGIALRFVYDYHMEPGANSFPANVDCINVFVFDSDGNYVTQFKETSDDLRNENYRMILPLDNGKYQLKVYGGTACEKTKFNLTPDWNSTQGAKMDDILVTLPRNEEGVSKVQLHNIEERSGGLFYGYAIRHTDGQVSYGTLDVELTDDDYAVDYREETVYLMNDVNNIQIILQELDSPYQADYTDYSFQIVDDNFILDSNNKAVHVATDTYQPLYEPYAFDNRIVGAIKNIDQNGAKVEEDENKPVQVACAEFSTSRLLMEHLPTARLQIFSNSEKNQDGTPHLLIDIPLVEYLLLIRGFGDSWIKSDQEFLDRQSRWTLMFFLQHGKWITTRISVNSWIVRINDIELGY